MVTHTIVIDPGHGGIATAGGSNANNATSSSGVLEKNMALDMATLVHNFLSFKNTLYVANNVASNIFSAAARMAQLSLSTHFTLNVIMTRSTDINLSLAARSTVARTNSAARFLSIHFNAFNGVARGVSTHIRPRAHNTNFTDDQRFAQRIQTAVFNAVRNRDPLTSDRGVRNGRRANGPAVLNDDGTHLGAGIPACLLEVEFIDVPAVDQLLNTGPNAATVRGEIAAAIGQAILDDL
jgi:N-acetylmuramoyl-L-alanine amidase